MTMRILDRAGFRQLRHTPALLCAVALVACIAGLGFGCSPEPTASATSQATAHRASGEESGPTIGTHSRARDEGGDAVMSGHELAMLQMVNDLRASVGVASLVHDPALTLVAKR